MMSTKLTIHWADYLILCLILMLCLGIGVFFAIRGRRKSTRDAYLLGDRNIDVLPVCLSLFVTYQSAISLIGIPSEIYFYGTMVSLFYVTMTSCYIIGLYTLIPLLYPLKVTSMYEVRRRLSKLPVTIFVTWCFVNPPYIC